jgi:hypothetical protein
MQRLGRQAALDAELQREWEEMYRMFAHDVVEQQHLADSTFFVRVPRPSACHVQVACGNVLIDENHSKFM